MAEAEGTVVVVDEPLAEEAPDTDDRMTWPVSSVKRGVEAYILHPEVNLPGCVPQNSVS